MKEITPNPNPGDRIYFTKLFFNPNPCLSALSTITLNTLFAVAAVLLGTLVFGAYGWILFLGLPIALGFTTVFIHGAAAPRGFLQFFAIGMLSLVTLFASLLILPIEGAGCLLMTAPLWIAANSAALGIAFAIHYNYWSPRLATRGFPLAALALAALLPLLMGAESKLPDDPPTIPVTTSVDIDAPPEIVWQNVLAFPPLPKPHDWVFHLGAAYPLSANIVGHGPGAVRHCNFSTGPFVEPITTWDENHLLQFNVQSSPPSMNEWSPYENLHPPHLSGYLVSQRGQFLLIPLPNHRTRLQGTTWYQIHMSPNLYWQLWASTIIHHIHLTVLNHIKQLSEAQYQLPAPQPGFFTTKITKDTKKNRNGSNGDE